MTVEHDFRTVVSKNSLRVAICTEIVWRMSTIIITLNCRNTML